MEFHDHTHASNFEKFVAVVEQTLKSWSRTGLDTIIAKGFQEQRHEQPAMVRVQASLQHRLPWRKEPYLLQLHLPTHHLARAAAEQHHSRRKPNVVGPTTDLPTAGPPAPLQSSPPWEVGVELDMAELQQDINAIMLEVESGEEVESKEDEEAEGARGERKQGARMQEQVQKEQKGQQNQRQQQIEQEQQQQREQQQWKGQQQQRQGLDRQQHPSSISVSTHPGPSTHASHTRSSTISQAAAAPCWHGWWPLRAGPRPFWRFIRQHKLQRWFGLDHFCVLVPHSYSRRLLDEDEANTLLAALRCALDGAGLPWPALLPVHDSLRDAYSGTAAIPPFSTLQPPPLLSHPHSPAATCTTPPSAAGA
eukprot:CAMPEP_0202375186 /NCGR_PEP_ID=MMETSP1127-20130417/5894_1 /ASSEMBLY_ACC=CAM_ASM_000462 /TAXON_ID=3047 /ORGANISM="Dunaliella tertiolecta, Strain CCMP1320" /LENGTH=363 /DNA_ID=CAMNT_0048972577 /DNA_START=65 /DNA_END=1153 /DNA_ORIENTATION=-